MTSPATPRLSIGIDFGTTNTVLAVARGTGEAEALSFSLEGVEHRVYNSTLCYWQTHRQGVTHTEVEGGPWAVEKYIEGVSPHRFIQSFKTFAASRAFTETQIFRQRAGFEALLATFLRTLLRHAGDRLPLEDATVVVGRPVRFAGGNPDEGLAMQRYRAGFGTVGLDAAHYVYEPVGAAFFFAQRLAADATVLVADFGGGTSDFTVMRFARRDGALRATPLGNAGIGIAGDAFDYRILDHVVSPRLGKGSDYITFKKRLTIPSRYYANFARWNMLPLMRGNGELRELQELARTAVDPEPLRHFIHIIEDDLGFDLYRAVTQAKQMLSSTPQVEFTAPEAGFTKPITITRAAFESWIAPDVTKIAETVDRALQDAGVGAGAIDQVFLTGGSSFIPVIRRIFAERFGEEKLATGDQFESIAYGLALIGQMERPGDWAVSPA